MSNLANNLLSQLLGDIVSKKFADNTLPGEHELCEQYNVSRSTLRSVLSVLEAKGVLIKQAKKKATISSYMSWDLFDPRILNALKNHLDPKEFLEQIFYLRLTVEPRACALAALNSDFDDLNRLHQALTRMKQGLELKDLEMFIDGDLSIHTAIYQSTHNLFFSSLKEFMRQTSEITIDNTAQSSDEDLQISVDDHEALINAIRIKNASQAQQQMITLLLKSMHKVFNDYQPSYLPLFLRETQPFTKNP